MNTRLAPVKICQVDLDPELKYFSCLLVELVLKQVLHRGIEDRCAKREFVAALPLGALAFRLGRWNQLQAIRERRHGPDIEPWRSVVDANTGWALFHDA